MKAMKLFDRKKSAKMPTYQLCETHNKVILSQYIF